MTKLIHTQSKIFFPTPTVLRLEYGITGHNNNSNSQHHLTVCRRAYRAIQGTWGHSPVMQEYTRVKNDYPNIGPPIVVNYAAGLSSGQQQQLILNPDWGRIDRAYFAFCDTADALQFKLTVDANAITVKMWPAATFTIHEFVTDPG